MPIPPTKLEEKKKRPLKAPSTLELNFVVHPYIELNFK